MQRAHTPHSPMPLVYRIFFLYIDPSGAALGLIGHLFTPMQMLKSYSVSPTEPPATETIFLTDTLVGFFAMTLFLQTYLLRQKPIADLAVWKAVQFSILLVDIAMLGAFGRALAREKRLNAIVWRSEEWTNLGVLLIVAVMRTSFCLGVGMSAGQRGKKV
ncbi:MAG: hypothetical protein Q9162_007976 [Coniocarpon cinnabarinum]